MMPSADHKTVLHTPTRVPVKNNIEQSPLSRAIRLPSDAVPHCSLPYSCVFSYRKSISDFTGTRPYFSPRTLHKFLECAITGKARVIISGDKDLLSIGRYRSINIQSPAKFLAAESAPSAIVVVNRPAVPLTVSHESSCRGGPTFFLKILISRYDFQGYNEPV
jgi:hypothetical protein